MEIAIWILGSAFAFVLALFIALNKSYNVLHAENESLRSQKDSLECAARRETEYVAGIKERLARFEDLYRKFEAARMADVPLKIGQQVHIKGIVTPMRLKCAKGNILTVEDDSPAYSPQYMPQYWPVNGYYRPTYYPQYTPTQEPPPCRERQYDKSFVTHHIPLPE